MALKKLLDNILTFRSSGSKYVNEEKDGAYFQFLEQYINDALSLKAINARSLASLKKIVVSMNHIIVQFSGSVSVLLLLERAKVLVIDKMKQMKNYMDKATETNKMSIKKGELSKERIKEIESQIAEKIKEKENLDKENELLRETVSKLKSNSMIEEEGIANDKLIIGNFQLEDIDSEVDRRTEGLDLN